MLSRYAFFVDAGYLFAQGSVNLFSTKHPRHQLDLDISGARTFLENQSKMHLPGRELLRIYWYDAAPRGSTPHHRQVASERNIKLRLGAMNGFGQQKGVDSLIVLDLIELARERAIADAFVISGDEDIRVGIETAQSYGVRVHLLGIAGNKSSNQSAAMVAEADTHKVLDLSGLGVAWLKHVPSISTPASSPQTPPQTTSPLPSATAIKVGITAPLPLAPVAGDPLQDAAQDVANHLGQADKEAIKTIGAKDPIPPLIDRRLLAAARKRLGRELDAPEKTRLRKHFRNCSGLPTS